MNDEWAGADELDLRGLKCPLPAMKTGRLLERMSEGQRLQVWATDPLCEIDIPNAVAGAGGRVVSQAREGRVVRFRIEKSSPSGEQSGRP